MGISKFFCCVVPSHHATECSECQVSISSFVPGDRRRCDTKQAVPWKHKNISCPDKQETMWFDPFQNLNFCETDKTEAACRRQRWPRVRTNNPLFEDKSCFPHHEHPTAFGSDHDRNALLLICIYRQRAPKICRSEWTKATKRYHKLTRIVFPAKSYLNPKI